MPGVVQAYEYGPPPRETGAPGDGTCADSGCHTGTGNPHTGASSNISITLSNGNTYTPGVVQHVQVKVTDSAQKKFGFELTARLASSPTSGQAGDFTTTDKLTQVVCDGFGSIKNNGSLCPSSTPVQFIQHTLSGYSASTAGSYTYSFDWTPPATAAGNIVLYASGNAANGDLSDQGDHIYTTSLTVTPAGPTNAPTITPSGIVPIFSSSTIIEPGSWNSIYGTNLTTGAGATWTTTNFVTTLDGTTVTVNGKPAYLWLVYPGQINFQAPDDTAVGTVNVAVTTSAGTATSTVTLGPYGPTFSMFDATYIAGVIPVTSGGAFGGGTYDYSGPAGHFGFSTRPVKKGETILLFGTGFGAAGVPAGQSFSGANKLPNNVKVVLGGVSMDLPVYEIGAGLYQINVTIPQNVGSGDQSLVATVANGLQTPSNVKLTIQ